LWITYFEDKRQFIVTVNGKYSSWHDVISGIPQHLGPLVFIIYITDLGLPDFSSDTVYMYIIMMYISWQVIVPDTHKKLLQDYSWRKCMPACKTKDSGGPL